MTTKGRAKETGSPAPLAEQLKIRGQVSVPLFVGGIGPASAFPFLENLLRLNTGATSDQQHIGYGLVNMTAFPDRTKALNDRNAGDPTAYNEVRDRIITVAQFARREGFGSISLLCNTIHAWRDDPLVRTELEKLGLPWISLMDSAVQSAIKRDHPNVTKVGILGTDGTLKAGLYTKAVSDAGLTPVNLGEGSTEQRTVMDAIYLPPHGIKTSGAVVTPKAIDQLKSAADHLVDQGAEVIIGGCTEIPLALNTETYNRVPTIDPLVALAKVHLDIAMGRRQEH